jgi:low temperature requirement protein LtrA
MRGIEVPEQTEDFTADPVELFFDLAFVFAFSQLVGFLVHHPDWEGVGKASLLFAIMWLGWSQVSWAANAVAGNSRPVRLIFLVATAMSVPMAASVSTAFDDNGLLFAVPIVIITQMGVALVVFASRGMAKAEASARRYAASTVLVSLVLVAGAVMPETPRIAMWMGAIALFVIATWRTSSGEWTMRAGHFAERHGLIIIVALGEVIVAVGKPLVDSLEEGESFSNASIIALSSAGVFACLLWWAYFDRVQPALEHRVQQTTGPDKARLARDNYTYFHLPIVAGIIASAAALEEITLHPEDTLPLAFRLMLFGGLALFLGGIGASAWRTFRAIARERLVGIVAIALLVFAGKSFDGVWIVVGLNVILVTVLIVEHLRIEHPHSATT